MLLSITYCDFCRRAEVDQCFITQINSVCAHYTSLCNSNNQCTVKSLITTALISERSNVVVLHMCIYDDKKDDSTL